MTAELDKVIKIKAMNGKVRWIILKKKGKEIAAIREKPGQSNAYKYPNVPKVDFAGPHGTYPVNTEARYVAAKRLAHHTPSSRRGALEAKIKAIGKRKGFANGGKKKG